MLYTELTNKAMKLAFTAHEGQYDKGGIPYIFHPYHLAEQMDNETRVCIALLHDVVEDTDITLERLRADFPTEVTEALALLTHDKNVDYYDYIKGICTNQDAAFVKLADLIHNMTETRLLGIDIGLEKKNRWFQKYAKALYMVVDFIENSKLQDDNNTYMLYQILHHYQGISRNVTLTTDRNPLEFLTEKQYDILKNTAIKEQMKFFKVQMVECIEGTVKSDYSETKDIPLEQYLDKYKTPVIAQGCIVGFFNINIEDSCKKHVQPVWVNGSKLFVKECYFKDFSPYDYEYVKACEKKSVRLVWV